MRSKKFKENLEKRGSRSRCTELFLMRRFFPAAFRKEPRCIGGRHGLCVVIALYGVTVYLSEEVNLTGFLDALGNRSDVQILRHLDNRPYNNLRALHVMRVLEEAAVQL